MKFKGKAITQFVVYALLVVSSQMLDVSRVMEPLSIELFQVVGDPSIAVYDSVRSFPIGAQLAIYGIFDGCYYLSQDEAPNIKVPRLDLGVVMLGHEVLVMGHLLFNRRPDFIQQIQLQAYSFFVPHFVMVSYPVASKPYLCLNNSIISKCKAEGSFTCGCLGHCSVCLQDAWQFIWPFPLCPFKPSLDYLKQGSVCNLNLSIGLWVGR